jgi:hypothetical protein
LWVGGQTHFALTGCDGAGAVGHAALDLFCHGDECLLYVGGILGRGFEQRNTKTIGEFLIRTRPSKR